VTDSIARIHYFEEQYLRTQEFVDEQAYHLAMRRRHNIAHHSWGIVAGLELVVEESRIWLAPGFGIDGFGRELVLRERQPLPPAAFADKGSSELEVWLEYDRVGSDEAPEGYAGCGDEEHPFYRWQEQPLVRLEVPDPQFTDWRHPRFVLEGDQDFPAFLEPPDDPLRAFPLFLGKVFAPAREGQPPRVDMTGRPYVDLVGAGVHDPADRAWLQLGPIDAADPNSVAIFVRVTDPAAQYDDPRLAIRRDGTVRVVGEMTVEGDLTLAGSGLELGEGSQRPANARPWRIYHVHDASADEHELRVEIAAPAGPGRRGLNRVVVGTWAKPPDPPGGQEAFQPCLTVADDGTVTVHGNLVVTGSIYAQAGTAEAQLSEEAVQFVTASFLSGVGGGSALLQRVFRSGLGRRQGGP
jgi:hypothetical protein